MRAEASQVPPAELRIMSVEPRQTSIWIKELPYSLVLLLTIMGVAYTSLLKQPIVVYWEILAVVIGAICIGTGWPSAEDKAARWRLVRTSGTALVCISARDEHDAVAERAEDPQCQCDWACHFHVAGTWYVYRWHSCRFLEGLPSRTRHGPEHSGDCVD